MPRRVQRTRPREKGAKGMPPGAKYVGRPGPFGNPFAVGDTVETANGPHVIADATEAVGFYRVWLLQHPEVRAAARRELTGLDLACWCKPDRPCHADVLLAVAASPPEAA